MKKVLAIALLLLICTACSARSDGAAESSTATALVNNPPTSTNTETETPAPHTQESIDTAADTAYHRNGIWDGFLLPKEPSVNEEDFRADSAGQRLYIGLPFAEYEKGKGKLTPAKASEYLAWRKGETDFRHFFLYTYETDDATLYFADFD